MKAWKHIFVLCLSFCILGLLVHPVSANPVANTSFKVTRGEDIWLFEISHPELAVCSAPRDYGHNCNLTLQYRITSLTGNTTRNFFGNGEVFNEQNVDVGYFGASTFTDQPSPQWKSQSLNITMSKDGNAYLAFAPHPNTVFETLSRKVISLKVKSLAAEDAERAAEQAAVLQKKKDTQLALQESYKKLKLSITCLKGKQKKVIVGDPPICPSGFKNPLSSFTTFEAFSKCQLYKKFSGAGGSYLADGGRTLVMNISESNAYSLRFLTYSDLECVKKILKVSSFVGSQISSTRAIDGVQRAQWGKISAFWNFHPDSGLNISFNSK